MGNHQCHVKSDGQLKCWGNNFYGQLGINSTDSHGDNANEMGPYLPYAYLGSGLSAKYVVVGDAHTCVHLNNDELKCYGQGGNGRLGLGSTDNTGDEAGEMGDALPIVNLGSSVIMSQIVSGYAHNCVLFDNKMVKCFGLNSSGQLGYENTTDRGTNSNQMGDDLPFVDLGTAVEVTSIHTSSESYHNCVILSTQGMKCWGNGMMNQLGYGNITNKGDTPDTMGDFLLEVDLGIESKVKIIGLGTAHTCALRVDDVFVCWGRNEDAQLGIGSKAEVVFIGSSLVPTPYDSTGSQRIKQIVASDLNTCILLDDNLTVKCVGGNSYGQLGQGDTVNRGDSSTNTFDLIPAVDFGTGALEIINIKMIRYVVCAEFSDNSLKCFGFGGSGMLGTGSTSNVGDDANDMGTNLNFIDLFSTFSPSVSPTRKPSYAPTSSPTSAPTPPTFDPTLSPTKKPTPPTLAPTQSPSAAPTTSPTTKPTDKPTSAPSAAPSTSPSKKPSKAPTATPTMKPTLSPTYSPSNAPSTISPTKNPSTTPTKLPSKIPTKNPTDEPTSAPTHSPSTRSPTNSPSDSPTKSPTSKPTAKPTMRPTNAPMIVPTFSPSAVPTSSPVPPTTSSPTTKPTFKPTAKPTLLPTSTPTNSPTVATSSPSKNPTRAPILPTPSPVSIPMDAPPTSSPSTSGSTNQFGSTANIQSIFMLMIICNYILM